MSHPPTSTAAPAGRTHRVVTLSAGTRRPSSSRRLADRLGDAVVQGLAGRDQAAEVTGVELRDLARDLADAGIGLEPSEHLATVLATVTSADALVAVTPLFQASYSGLFKSFFDVLGPTAIAGMPVLLGATGGTVRHSLALDTTVRPLFTYLRANLAATAVFAAPEDWTPDGDTHPQLGQRIDRAAAELSLLLDSDLHARTLPTR